MKKYLGSKITAYAAFVAPLFLVFPLVFGVSMLSIGISGSAIILALGGVMCTLVWGLYLVSVSNQLYSWGCFDKKGVQVSVGLSKKHMIIYEKCRSCGIGFYMHGFLNSKVGTKVYFIFLSYDVFDESFRSNINLWKPTKTQIKVEFSPKMYDYLVSTLPKKQSLMLQNDYERYIKHTNSRI